MAPVRNTNSTHPMRPTAPTEKDALAMLGHQLTRTIEMWWPGADVVVTGKEMESVTNDDLADMHESATGRKARIIELVNHLNVWEPGFFEHLNQAGTHAVAAARNARNQLNDGQSNSRSKDAQKVREAMPRWRVWDPPLGDGLT
ncbi:hypothetical protein FRC10_004703 [Ceratobasidium sp. 414]|nr:hypothetical protein FRC10_004703 [Ceratobasidium sp. 414]